MPVVLEGFLVGREQASYRALSYKGRKKYHNFTRLLSLVYADMTFKIAFLLF